ncbi:HS12A-like protein [Mya arenaria]|uniref:HS12A-like protein n=1 Tax=Mya arenaria TaxID=6604 RepID=A0ABY7FZH4_MYAAR|nr:HS12A-like protein [Mya arenaria]WAR26457.1 HS12A-like protein [Mya arenaria]
MSRPDGNKRPIVPAEAGLTVLKDAVKYGHDSSIISSQVMKYTFGVSVNNFFDDKIHSERKTYLNKDGKWCAKDCFDLFVGVKEEIYVDHKITKGYSRTGYRAKTPIHSTTAAIPIYSTDLGCELLGELIPDLPN